MPTWSFSRCLRKKNLVKLSYFVVAVHFFCLNAFNLSYLSKCRTEYSCWCLLLTIIHVCFHLSMTLKLSVRQFGTV